MFITSPLVTSGLTSKYPQMDSSNPLFSIQIQRVRFHIRDGSDHVERYLRVLLPQESGLNWNWSRRARPRILLKGCRSWHMRLRWLLQPTHG